MKLGIFAIIKDEYPYLQEWIAYHRSIGVEHFFIADNGSTDGSFELLQQLQQRDICTVIRFVTTPDTAPQLPAYRALIKSFSASVDWMAFIDADEFITITDAPENTGGDSFFENFKPASNVGAIALNWACYGSSGQQHYENAPVLKRFEKRAEQNALINHHYKMLVRSKAFESIGTTPHHILIKKNYIYTQSSGKPLIYHPVHGQGLSAEVDWYPIRLNHYVVKSHQEFFEWKGPRGRATAVGRTKGKNYFRGHDRNDEHETVPAHIYSSMITEYNNLDKLLKKGTNYIDKIALKSPNNLDPKNTYLAKIDRISRENLNLHIQGWATDPCGQSIPDLQLRIGNTLISSQLRTIKRPDVVRNLPGSDEDTGFHLTCSLLEPALIKNQLSDLHLFQSNIGKIADISLPEELIDKDAGLNDYRQGFTLPDQAKNALTSALSDTKTYLAYGFSSSCNLVTDRADLQIISIETDWRAIKAIQLSRLEKGAKSHLHALYSNIGPVKSLGYPIDESDIKNWQDYPLLPWQYLANKRLKPDVIMIDGRFRRACFLASLIFSQSKTRIFIDDYTNRPIYHSVERHLEPMQIHGCMAEFIRPDNITTTAIWLDLLKAIYEPQ